MTDAGYAVAGQKRQVAALFVEKGGCYYGLNGVDPWPAGRDARLYNGPHPVVAHPPCQLSKAASPTRKASITANHQT